jgi:hypothetical protein
MKRVLFLGLLFCAVTLSLPAKGFYFDLGLGSGAATTKVDGNKVTGGLAVSEVAIDLGMKAGYGPFDKLPLYAVADIGAMGHRFSSGGDYLHFNTYLIGPGVIFYPIPLIQLAASLGYSFTANQSSSPTAEMYNSKPGGFGGSVSAALDLGKGKNTCLLGLKFSGTTNTLEVSNVKQDTTLLGLFFRYAYRNRAASA